MLNQRKVTKMDEINPNLRVTHVTDDDRIKKGEDGKPMSRSSFTEEGRLRISCKDRHYIYHNKGSIYVELHQKDYTFFEITGINHYIETYDIYKEFLDTLIINDAGISFKAMSSLFVFLYTKNCMCSLPLNGMGSIMFGHNETSVWIVYLSKVRYPIISEYEAIDVFCVKAVDIYTQDVGDPSLLVLEHRSEKLICPLTLEPLNKFYYFPILEILESSLYEDYKIIKISERYLDPRNKKPPSYYIPELDVCLTNESYINSVIQPLRLSTMLGDSREDMGERWWLPGCIESLITPEMSKGIMDEDEYEEEDDTKLIVVFDGDSYPLSEIKEDRIPPIILHKMINGKIDMDVGVMLARVNPPDEKISDEHGAVTLMVSKKDKALNDEVLWTPSSGKKKNGGGKKTGDKSAVKKISFNSPPQYQGAERRLDENIGEACTLQRFELRYGKTAAAKIWESSSPAFSVM